MLVFNCTGNFPAHKYLCPNQTLQKRNILRKLTKFHRQLQENNISKRFQHGRKFFDRTGGNASNTHQIGYKNLNKIKNTQNLIDTWQKSNPHKSYFTYHNSDYRVGQYIYTKL